MDGKEVELEVLLRPTGWSDANGVHGWDEMKGPEVSTLDSRNMAPNEIEPK